MLNYLLHHRPGRFLLIGSFFLILGFIGGVTGWSVTPLLYYTSMFFLGFYAAKNAIIDSFQNKELNVDVLMVLAAVGAALINFESEGAILLFIFALAEVLENYANNRSTQSIEALMSQVPKTAQRLRSDGDVEEVPTESLSIGDIVIVSKGSQLPIDGHTDRQIQVNEAALTGESVPVEKFAGDEVFAGTINEGHAFQLTVSKNAEDTVFSNIIRMVEEAQGRPSRLSTFIDRIESKYVIAVLIAVPLFFLLFYYGFKLDFQMSFYRTMVFLTVASPCALVASATPATLSAISNGARNGVLTKGGAAFEALSQMDTLFSDKTGTITYGHFQLVDYQASEEVIREVVFMEQQSSHPIAEAIVNHFDQVDLSQSNKSQAVEEIAGVGIKKGDLIVGKPAAFEDYHDPKHYRQKADGPHTTIFACQDHTIVGYFALADEIRPSARTAIRHFQQEGIDVQILTGDNQQVAEQVAKQVGVPHFAAGLMPEDKIKMVDQAQDQGHMVGMIGDGINDAPALASADIGIAMGSGSSVAMESSEVVIVQNDLAKLYYSFRMSKRLNQIIRQNVIFAVAVIIILILLNILGLISLPLAVIGHEGSTILVILNGLRLLKNQSIEN